MLVPKGFFWVRGEARRVSPNRHYLAINHELAVSEIRGSGMARQWGDMMNSCTSGFSRALSNSHDKRKRLHGRLLLGTAAIALLASPAAFANPKDGAVTSGSATISSSPQLTTIDQTSQGVVIDWSSFNIGNGQTTQFLQPNSSSVAINRIGSASASSILGTLDANGRIVLINGNGLAFGRNSQVNVGSLIATTTGGSDSDLLAGKFTKAGNQNASIINRGTITAAGGGTVALVAPNVTNRGTVQAKLGTVSLGAANAFTVDFAGDGLVSFAAQGDVNGKAQVTNAGTLSGANVSMTARAAEGLATGVVNVRGTIQALGAHNVGGTIVLDAGDGGSIDVSHASLNASGANGGGSVTIGGWNQSSVVVDRHSIVNASATKSGNGGTIDVTAAANSFRGQALASGGSQSGNGGNIETSGHVLDVNGAWISTTAAHGTTGNWSLDPYNVRISSASTSNGSVSGGVFTPTSNNSILNATTLEDDLANTSITVNTGSSGTQAGNITIARSLTWNAATTLTLDAYHSIDIDAAITITGAGGLTLITDDGGTGGTLSFGSTGNVAFTDVVGSVTQGTLSIGGNSYTLENNLGSLESDIDFDASGFFALAADLYAGGYTYLSTPVPTVFTGTFEGLGNTISNLTVHDTSSETDVGLFGQIGAGGTVRDLNLVDADVTSTNASAYVGAVAGENYGTIENVSATGSVADLQNNAIIGGLVGANDETISSSNASVSVTTGYYGDAGGLAGINNDEISDSYATGSATGGYQNYIGGLVGDNEGTIANSYATGEAYGNDVSPVGGLVGYNNGGISYSYATGEVSSFENSQAGGLVGLNTTNGSISYSYATGSVSAYGFAYAGGLVGDNEGQISYAYAMGAVVVGINATAGGLIGYNNGTVSQTYATGAVLDAPTGTLLGGLIGYDNAAPGSVTNSYWDMDTSGITNPSQGAGNVANDSGITGEATANLQGTLPANFDNTVWGTGAGLYPYFLWQYPTGTPQTITGTAYTDAGSTPDEGDTIFGLLDGNAIGTGSSGANGYYYILLAPGSLSGTEAAYVQSSLGATVADNLGPSSAVMDIWGSYFRDLTGESSLSAAGDNIDTALGTDIAADEFAAGLSNEDIVSSAASFTIDAELLRAGDTTVKTTSGDLYVEYSQEWFYYGTLTLDSFGSIYVRQPIEIDNNTGLSLVTSDGGSGNLVFQGGDVFFSNPPTSTLTINGQGYTLVSNIATLASDISSNPSGFYALANSYDASADGTYTQAPVQRAFTGTFEGLGNTISNLSIDDPGLFGNAGLFAEIGSGGTVRDIGLLNVDITGGIQGYTGALAAQNYGTIFGSFASGGSVTAGGASDVGGLVGYNDGNLAESFASDSVQGSSNSYLGGLVGYNVGPISQSYASGPVTGTKVSAIGGFVGFNSGAISSSYATGTVAELGADVFTEIGGFVGINAGSIDESYSIGAVSPGNSNYFGAFAGINGGTIGGTTADYFDSDANPGMAAVGDGGTATALYGLTTSQFLNSGNFTGWTFGTTGSGADWVIVDGDGTLNNSGGVADGSFPFLLMEYSTQIYNEHQLQLMALDVNAEYFVENNIVYDGVMWGADGFAPVGNLANPFQGVFVGNEFTISNLTIDRPTQDYVGLFGVAGEDAGIYDFALSGGSVTGADYVGAVAGSSDGFIWFMSSDLNVTGAYDPATLATGNNVGGIAGYIDGPEGLFIVTATGNVSGNQNVGGLVGSMGFDGSFSAATASGNVQGIANVGGAVGANDGLVEGVTATGNVTGAAPSPSSAALVGAIGGLVGYNMIDGYIAYSNAGGTVTSSGTTSNASVGTGGLVGTNDGVTDIDDYGQIFQSYATGAVSGQIDVGGLVGANTGQIIQSFSTGTASGTYQVGGFVGDNTAGGFVQDSYSMGEASVTGSFAGQDGAVGGFAGENAGEIDHAYSTGMVTCTATDACPGTLGGFIGKNDGTIDANSFWDTQTSGIPSVGVGTDNTGQGANVYGETTTTLQAALDATWDPSVWGIVSGISFPYLQWQTDGLTPQVIAGTITNGASTVSGQSVGAYIDGSADDVLVSAASGANGYYYVLLAPYSISSDSNVFAYLNGGGPVGNAFVQGATGSLTSLAIDEGQLEITSATGTASSVLTAMDAALGGATGFELLYTDASGFADDADVLIDDSANAFIVNTSLDVNGGTLAFDVSGNLTENSAGSIDAGTLTGSAGDEAVLQGTNNEIADLGDFTTTEGRFGLADGENLTISGTVNASVFSVTLIDTGTLDETTGAIDAAILKGSSAGGATLNGANLIGELETFTNSGAGGFALTDGESLTVNGTNTVVNGGTGDLSLTTTGTGDNIVIDKAIKAGGTVTLNSAGTITENISTGIVTAGTLAGSSGGQTSLKGANAILGLGAFTSTGNFSLTDDRSLTLTGALAAAGYTVTLADTGAIGETTGAIDAATLTGSSMGGVTLNGDNLIGTLGAFSNTGSDGFALTDGETLAVGGAVNSGTGRLTLTTTGAGDNIAINKAVTAGTTVTLDSSGKISESKTAGIITATVLTGSSDGGASLNGANEITDLDTFTNTGSGGFALTNAEALKVKGPVAAGPGNASITLTSGNLTLTGGISGDDVTLTSDTGDVDQTAGTIAAGDVLTVNADTGIVLDDDNTYTTEHLHTTTGTVTGH